MFADTLAIQKTCVHRRDVVTCWYVFADESGSDSDGAASTSSSYSSLSDFVIDMQNSDITGDTPGPYASQC